MGKAGHPLDYMYELMGFVPIGMMEYWNNGFWGIDGMGYWEYQVDKPEEK